MTDGRIKYTVSRNGWLVINCYTSVNSFPSVTLVHKIAPSLLYWSVVWSVDLKMNFFWEFIAPLLIYVSRSNAAKMHSKSWLSRCILIVNTSYSNNNTTISAKSFKLNCIYHTLWKQTWFIQIITRINTTWYTDWVDSDHYSDQYYMVYTLGGGRIIRMLFIHLDRWNCIHEI